MRRILTFLLLEFDNNPITSFLLVVLVNSFISKPHYLIQALLLFLAVGLVKHWVGATSSLSLDVLFRWGALRHFLNRHESFRLRLWPMDNATVADGISNEIADQLKVKAAAVSMWKAKGSMDRDLEALQIFTAELKERAIPPALKSFPSFIGPAFIIVYHTPAECAEKPFARFLLYHEIGHLSRHGMQQRFETRLQTALILFILVVFLPKGIFLYAAVVLAILLFLSTWRDGLRRELRADTYAAERVFRTVGLAGLDRVIEIYRNRRDDFLAKREHQTGVRETLKFAATLHLRLDNLIYQRDALEQTGMSTFHYNLAFVIFNVGLVTCAAGIRQLSWWILPAAILLWALTMVLYYFVLGFFLRSVDELKYTRWRNCPY